MYEAQKLTDEIYSANDLPDAMYVYADLLMEDLSIVVLADDVLAKNGSMFESGTKSLFKEGDAVWRFLDSEEPRSTFGRQCLSSEEYPFQPTRGEQGLLISIQDTFLDTYTVIPPVVAGLTNTISRVSLCVWEADNGGSAEPLFREPLIYAPVMNELGLQHGWHLSTFNGFTRKSGFQNTPIGEYIATEGTYQVTS